MVQKLFLVVKYEFQKLHISFHVPIFLISRSLNLLEPSGPVQVCNGIALPLSLHISY